MKKLHQTVAKTLRYSGYKALCVQNSEMNQPYEVVLSNVSDEELKQITSMIWDMFDNKKINIVSK